MAFMAAGAPDFTSTGRTPKHVDHVVTALQPLVQVPKNQIEKYVGLRSDKSVEKLQQLLGDYKSGSRDGSKASSSVASNAPATLGRGTAGLVDHFKRDWKSSYKAHFGGPSSKVDRRGSHPGPAVQKSVLRSSEAFQKVWKPDKQEELKQWKASANDENIQQLADLCRGICSAGDGHTSEYKKRFQTVSGARTPRLEPLAIGSMDKNVSRVPIGSIYRTDPWELEASGKREVEMKESFQRIQENQEQMKHHRNLPKKQEQLIFIDRYQVDKSRGSQDVTACLSGQQPKGSGPSTTEYRTQFATQKPS